MNKKVFVSTVSVVMVSLGLLAADTKVTSYTATEQFVRNLVKAESNRTDTAIQQVRQDVIDAKYLTASSIIAGSHIIVTSNEAGQVTITATGGGEGGGVDIAPGQNIYFTTADGKTVINATSVNLTTNNPVLVSNFLTRAEADAGFTMWECNPPMMSNKVFSVRYDPEWSEWELYGNGEVMPPSVIGTTYDTNLNFVTQGVTASRKCLTPTKISQLENDVEWGLSTNDVCNIVTNETVEYTAEWDCMPAEMNGIPFVVYEDSYMPNQRWMLVWGASIYAQGDADSTLLVWQFLDSGTNIVVTANRRRRFTGNALGLVRYGDKISELTNDIGFVTASEVSNLVGSVELTAVYGDWVCDPATNRFGTLVSIKWGDWEGDGWYVVNNGGSYNSNRNGAASDAVILSWNPDEWDEATGNVPLTATRSLIGYYIGDQTNKVLAATNMLGEASVDTNTVMAIVTNAVADKIGPYPFGEPTFAQTGDWTFSGTLARTGYHWEIVGTPTIEGYSEYYLFEIQDGSSVSVSDAPSSTSDSIADSPAPATIEFSNGVTATRGYVCTLTPFVNNQVETGRWMLTGDTSTVPAGWAIFFDDDPGINAWYLCYPDGSPLGGFDSTEGRADDIKIVFTGSAGRIVATRSPSAFTVSVAVSSVTNTMRDLWFVVAVPETNAPSITWTSEFDRIKGDMTPLPNFTNIYHISEYQSGRFSVDVIGSSGGGSSLDTNTVSAIVTNLVTQGWWSEWTFTGNVVEGVVYSVFEVDTGIENIYSYELRSDGESIDSADTAGESSSVDFTNEGITATRCRIPAQRTSDLTNDSGFVTASVTNGLATTNKVSQKLGPYPFASAEFSEMNGTNVYTFIPFTNTQVEMGKWNFSGTLPESGEWNVAFDGENQMGSGIGWWLQDANFGVAFLAAPESATTLSFSNGTTARLTSTNFMITVADSLPIYGSNPMRDLLFVLKTDATVPTITWAANINRFDNYSLVAPTTNSVSIYYIYEYNKGNFAVVRSGAGLSSLSQLVNDMGFAPDMQSVTWDALTNAVSAGSLIAGAQYRITDFVSTTSQANTQSASHAFDLIVIADATNKVNETARAIAHEGDSYFANCNLAAWQVQYAIGNDTNRFSWANGTNGKGVIYRLVDEYGNDCPYDFKNIKFKAYGDTDNVFRYTFDSGAASGNTDLSLSRSNAIYGNRIGAFLDGGIQSINLVVAKGQNVYDNILAAGVNNIVLTNGCHDISIGNYCSNIRFLQPSAFVIIEGGNTGMDFNPEGASVANPYKYVTVQSGAAPGSTIQTITEPATNKIYHTTYQPTGSKVISL